MNSCEEVRTLCGRKTGWRIAFKSAALNDEKGQTLAEMALALPMLLLMLVGVIEFGRIAYFSIEVSNAAHAGVQYGAQSRASAADNAGMVQAALNDGQNVSGLSGSVSHSCVCSNGSATPPAAPNCALSDCSSGQRLTEYVQVDTSATVSPLFHYPGIPASFSLSGRAIMRVAQ
jgi:Flp pilus assembly protein TadG